MSDETVSLADNFLFDAQGFVILRGVLSPDECARYREELERLYAQDYADPWRETLKGQTTLQLSPGQRRLNGLPILSDVFDPVIDNPQVLARLRAWMVQPQLVNTWAIDKTDGAQWGGWHRGLQPDDYSVRRGKIRTRMLNCVYFLTDNGPDDGCLTVVPGAHKSEFDLDMAEYRNSELPGTMRATGQAGDVVMFTETLLHNGAPKTTSGHRTNLYFNWVDMAYNVAMREVKHAPGNLHHYIFPPDVRARFNDDQRDVTQWMEWMRRDPLA